MMDSALIGAAIFAFGVGIWFIHDKEFMEGSNLARFFAATFCFAFSGVGIGYGLL